MRFSSTLALLSICIAPLLAAPAPNPAPEAAPVAVPEAEPEAHHRHHGGPGAFIYGARPSGSFTGSFGARPTAFVQDQVAVHSFAGNGRSRTFEGFGGSGGAGAGQQTGFNSFAEATGVRQNTFSGAALTSAAAAATAVKTGIAAATTS
ncbi:MAG: hypothetical protein LQ338_006577 [Usnochroma carphineum]|nr:MAG: hypothetical protein LQ338_006577 [Usnochroma carphineum]